MIIEYNFANDLLERIEEELINYDDKNKIQVIKRFSLSKLANLEWMRKSQDFSFPINSSGSTEIIQITKEFYELLVNGWKEKHHELVKDGIPATIESMMESDFPDETIHSAIYDKVSRLIYQYDEVLKCSKETNGLFGIEDEEKILLIHLNKYNEILSSDFKQIEFLHGVTLNKKISDLILEIYIRFINLRLEMLNPKITQIEERKTEIATKILWKGSQRDLCELFIELQEKEWINEFEWGERNKMAQSICNLFDLTLTKKNKNSNVENSFYQILKGTHNPKTKKREYDEVLGNVNDRKFNEIKNRC
ncbi:hypothetical protein [Formosa algae]|uniref:Uncharacterized protein n=1 Tax=Formosa algae TaxID=225843 RepID=A0A9X0YL18_9FLAO|nr:hypothetical protein [Formosa algae]MBP1838866.1 hypothetical protein [Formosa algae]MDQ0333643.1 hypothetical protein [Formosa algae]OEI78833.1 hypothetical protein AST99_16785 [Formosa algae]